MFVKFAQQMCVYFCRKSFGILENPSLFDQFSAFESRLPRRREPHSLHQWTKSQLTIIQTNVLLTIFTNKVNNTIISKCYTVSWFGFWKLKATNYFSGRLWCIKDNFETIIAESQRLVNLVQKLNVINKQYRNGDG